MSSIYKWIARLVVETMHMRYGREIRIAARVGAGLATLAALGVGAYLATRGDNEEAGLSE